MERDERTTTDPRQEAIRGLERAQPGAGVDMAAASAKRPGSVMDRFSFEVALAYLREGQRVARLGWNGPGQYIQMQVPDGRSRMTLPYIFIHTKQRQLVPWLASQTDLLAFDWCVVSERTVLVYGDERSGARTGTTADATGG